MKKVKLTLLAVLIVMFSSAQVATSSFSVKNPLKKQIRDYVKYPEFGHENQLEGKVILVFSISDDNQIKVENIISKNTQLSEYIIKSLEGKTVSTENEEVKDLYAMSFEFKYAE
jgi:uncharacterized protein YxeA